METLTVTVKINLGSWQTSEGTRLLTRGVLEAWRRNSKGKHNLFFQRAAFHAVTLNPTLLSALTDLLNAMAANLAPGTHSALTFPLILTNPVDENSEAWLVGFYADPGRSCSDSANHSIVPK